MYQILDRLSYFIETPAEQWDQHQIRLEQVTANLLELMRECRKPHDLLNEVNLSSHPHPHFSSSLSAEKIDQTRRDARRNAQRAE